MRTGHRSSSLIKFGTLVKHCNLCFSFLFLVVVYKGSSSRIIADKGAPVKISPMQIEDQIISSGYNYSISKCLQLFILRIHEFASLPQSSCPRSHNSISKSC